MELKNFKKDMVYCPRSRILMLLYCKFLCHSVILLAWYDKHSICFGLSMFPGTVWELKQILTQITYEQIISDKDTGVNSLCMAYSCLGNV